MNPVKIWLPWLCEGRNPPSLRRNNSIGGSHDDHSRLKHVPMRPHPTIQAVQVILGIWQERLRIHAILQAIGESSDEGCKQWYFRWFLVKRVKVSTAFGFESRGTIRIFGTMLLVVQSNNSFDSPTSFWLFSSLILSAKPLSGSVADGPVYTRTSQKMFSLLQKLNTHPPILQSHQQREREEQRASSMLPSLLSGFYNLAVCLHFADRKRTWR